MSQRINTVFWDDSKKRWNSHLAFKTVDHWHVSDYSSEVSAEVMIVKCSNGQFYIEDNFGDATNVPNVFNPKDENGYPVFYSDFSAVNESAAKVVASITGTNFKELMIDQ